jgi:hypothetical protein
MFLFFVEGVSLCAVHATAVVTCCWLALHRAGGASSGYFGCRVAGHVCLPLVLSACIRLFVSSDLWCA